MKWRIAALATFLVFLGTATASAGTNLLSNPGYETGVIAPWNACGVSSSFKRSGSYAAFCSGNGSGLSQTITWGGGDLRVMVYVSGMTSNWKSFRMTVAGVNRDFQWVTWTPFTLVDQTFTNVAAGNVTISFTITASGTSDYSLYMDDWFAGTTDGPDAPTSTPTNTPTATQTFTPTATNTATPTSTSTPIPTNTPTLTVTPIPTNTPTATHTPLPTLTNTPLPTATNPPPTATRTPTATSIPGVATPTRTPFAITIPDPTTPASLDQALARWIQQNWMLTLGAMMIGISLLEEFLKASEKAVKSTFVVATKRMLDKDGGDILISRRLQGRAAMDYVKKHGVEEEEDDDDDKGDPGYQGPPFTASSPPVGYQKPKFEDSPPARYPGFGRDWSD